MNGITFDPGPLAEVDCQAGDGRWTLVFTRELPHPPDKVWRALTAPDQLRGWAPYTADRDLGAVGEATLTMIDGDEPYEIPVSVLRAEPPSLLEHTWGSDQLRWKLAAARSGSELTLRHTVADPDSVPKLAAGWHLCLVVAEHLLDGRPIEPIRGKDALNYGWEELSRRYEQQLDGTTG
jgi:uncharacterized protein YndB with AHSA1/START domain